MSEETERDLARSEAGPPGDAELRALAEVTAGECRSYLDAVTLVAAGEGDEAAVPLLVLAVSQLLAAGARLGATRDVLPRARFEPDVGPEPDVEPLRMGLARVLLTVDGYTETADPLTMKDVVPGSLSDDLASVASDIAHGLRHFESGDAGEAMWWWQFSYLSNWGSRGAGALRALLSLLSHARLDIDADIAAEAAFEALHA